MFGRFKYGVVEIGCVLVALAIDFGMKLSMKLENWVSKVFKIMVRPSVVGWAEDQVIAKQDFVSFFPIFSVRHIILTIILTSC